MRSACPPPERHKVLSCSWDRVPYAEVILSNQSICPCLAFISLELGNLRCARVAASSDRAIERRNFVVAIDVFLGRRRKPRRRKGSPMDWVGRARVRAVHRSIAPSPASTAGAGKLPSMHPPAPHGPKAWTGLPGAGGAGRESWHGDFMNEGPRVAFLARGRIAAPPPIGPGPGRQPRPRRFGGSEVGRCHHFRHVGQALQHLLDAVLPQRAHAR